MKCMNYVDSIATRLHISVSIWFSRRLRRRLEVATESPMAPATLGGFPELAALEAQFQQQLGKVRTCPSDVEDGNAYASTSASWTGTPTHETLNPSQSSTEYPSLAALEAQFGERLKEARSTNAKGGVSNVPKPRPRAKPKQGPAPEEKVRLAIANGVSRENPEQLLKYSITPH